MKNLLNISEEEKSRILEMHETATNKHYLNEQPTVGAGVLAGAAAGSVVPGVGTLVGGVGGAVVGTIISIINGSDAASQKVQKIINNCGNKFPVTSRTNKIADSVYNAISGVGTDEGGVYNAIKASTSIAEFCGVVKSYKDSYGEDLYTALDGDFDSENEWVQIMRPLRDIVLKSQGTKPQQQPMAKPQLKPDTRPQAPDTRPQAPASRPQVPRPQAPDTRPQAPASRPQVPASRPQVPRPQAPASRPQVPASRPQVTRP
jgi:hypothetical protein